LQQFSFLLSNLSEVFAKRVYHLRTPSCSTPAKCSIAASRDRRRSLEPLDLREHINRERGARSWAKRIWRAHCGTPLIVV
jgi:hypothetical protein